MAKFQSKEEVDTWYESAMEGLGQAAALRFLEVGAVDGSYTSLRRSLDKVKTDAYRCLGLSEEPALVEMNDLVKKHLNESLRG